MLVTPSQSDATQVATAITASRSINAEAKRGMQSFQQENSTRWLVIADYAFPNTADGDAWYSDIRSKWQSGSLRNRILAGSRASVHDCTHEDAIVQNCRTTQAAESVKV